jgi:uncharacterized repeat protein (TIGR03803 family)
MASERFQWWSLAKALRMFCQRMFTCSQQFSSGLTTRSQERIILAAFQAVLSPFCRQSAASASAFPISHGSLREQRGEDMSYWKAVCLCCALFAATAITSPAQVFTTLANFGGSDGTNPFAGLVQGFDGNFYGTTYYGGANNSGTVFKIAPAGKLITLYRFCAQSGCADGAHPAASLVQASNGDFYGTTLAGGANDDGTVFKITTLGTLTTLHSFDGSDEGLNPTAGLILATNGNFYGATEYGGGTGGGTVFKITPSGTVTTLYRFCAEYLCADGRDRMPA